MKPKEPRVSVRVSTELKSRLERVGLQHADLLTIWGGAAAIWLTLHLASATKAPNGRDERPGPKDA